MWKMILIFSCMSLISSCHLFQKPENKLSYPPIWEYDFNIGYFSSIDPILYVDKVIYSGLDEKRKDFLANSTLLAFDKENGIIKWDWSDTIDPPDDKFHYESQYVVNKNQLFISTGANYSIDLQTGKTLFSDENRDEPSGGLMFYNHKNMVYSSFRNELNTLIKYTDFDSFTWTTLFQVERNDSVAYTFYNILPDTYQEQVLHFPITKYENNKLLPGIIKYDLNSKSIIKEKIIEVSESGHFIDNFSTIIDNKIFIPCNGIVICVRSSDGELIWKTPVNGNTSRSGIMYAVSYGR